ncbi:PucR family transcriptional regulator [Niallia sp. JL1B1071]|uniref:PucR family transcriptional regulator n=1 Tax=Niallia tiangongensis TaxID=3237105 RepID=UPI0037DCE81D
MLYTIKDILSEPVLQGAVLLSGKNKINSLSIESVSVIEMPVEDFVREKELVLTTAMGCGSSNSLFLSFVEEIYKSGAVALAIAVGRHVQEIPPEVIAFGKEKDFPIIHLPWELRFSDITKMIYRQINFSQEEAIRINDDIQKQLLQLFLNNQPLEEALQLLSNHFDTAILLFYGKNLILPVVSNPVTPASKIWKIIESQSITNPTTIHKGNQYKFQIFPILTITKQPCYLVLEIQNTCALQPWSFIQQHATNLQLWFQKQAALLSNRKKEKEQFVQLLINGSWENKEQLLEKGISLQYELDIPYVCILGQPEKVDENGEKLIITLYDISSDIAKKLNRKIIHAFVQGRFILFVEVVNSNPNISANEFLDHIDFYIQNGTLPLFSWGIGENHAGLYTFHEGYKDSMTALEIGRNYKGPGTRSTYANTGILRVLSVLNDNPTVTEMMHTIMGKVASYDSDKGLDLLHTLAVYLKKHSNVSQTARELSLHRQSLLYRLKKIETLTGRSLNDADDLFLLQLCLQLWTLRFNQWGGD